MKFETGQTSEPTRANISSVSRSSKRGPTMLRSFAQHIQQCCAGARALHATYPYIQLFQKTLSGRTANVNCGTAIARLKRNMGIEY